MMNDDKSCRRVASLKNVTVEATQKAAGGPTGGADILEQVRGSPAVHTDEMGWWEYGHNDERR